MSTPPEIADPIDMIVLSGFLGSGKTTLLARYLAEADREGIAVIVNEVGDVSIDGLVIEERASLNTLTLLSNGCVCCSIGSDLAMTIDRLIEERSALDLPPLRKIILETSGLSRPGAILRQLQALSHHRIRTSVVTLFDCTRPSLVANSDEALAQLAAANIVGLTKLDLVAPDAVDFARASAAALNPLAKVIVEENESRRASLLFADQPDRHDQPSDAAVSVGPHPDISVWNRRLTSAVDPEDVFEWMENLAGLCGDRLLRMKGTFTRVGIPGAILVQSVGTTFATPLKLDRAIGGGGFTVISRRVLDDHILQVGPSLPWGDLVTVPSCAPAPWVPVEMAPPKTQG